MQRLKGYAMCFDLQGEYASMASCWRAGYAAERQMAKHTSCGMASMNGEQPRQTMAAEGDEGGSRVYFWRQRIGIAATCRVWRTTVHTVSKWEAAGATMKEDKCEGTDDGWAAQIESEDELRYAGPHASG
jgi:hypothetical protein